MKRMLAVLGVATLFIASGALPTLGRGSGKLSSHPSTGEKKPQSNEAQ